MKKWRFFTIGLCLLLAGCQDIGLENDPFGSGKSDTDPVVEVLPRPETIDYDVVPITGETLSPNGRWEVRQVGTYAGVTVDGTYAPERVQVIDVATEEILWEGSADHRQAVLWSPDSRYLALSRTSSNYGYITLIETTGWTDWDVTPPEGSAIPKYTFLPGHDWAEWVGEDQVRLTVGRNGNAGPRTSYRCLLTCGEDGLSATTLEQTTEILPGEYDFNHDGQPEWVEVIRVFDSSDLEQFEWLELCVRNVDGVCLWKWKKNLSHTSCEALFALHLEEEDYLLRYSPNATTAVDSYLYYCVFSFNKTWEEVILDELDAFAPPPSNKVQEPFDMEKYTAFLGNMQTYLDDSVLLLSTEDGDFSIGGSGADFLDDFQFEK